MHTIESLIAGGIDGTITCKCSYQKYYVYPGAGWGRKSVGIKRSIGQTKKEYVTDKLVNFYVMHVAKAHSERHAPIGA